MGVQRRLLSPADAATYLGVTEGAIRKMAYRRQLPFVKRGRSLQFDRVALDRWIDDHTVPAEAS